MKEHFDDKEIECRHCNKKIKPLLKLNRTKSEFIGDKYTGKDKKYWLICPHCKTVIGTK